MSDTAEQTTLTGCQRRVGYLELSPDPVLAIADLPRRARAQTAVLLLGPFGWEEMCSHRALRTWARQLAQAGHPAVRIDLPSTGDSGGLPRDAGRLRSWTQAVCAAIDYTRALAAGGRVCVVGVELGGLLACLALAEGASAEELILWGVPARGRALLRQWRARAAVIAAHHPEDHRAPEPDGTVALSGFALTQATARELAAVGLQTLALKRPPERVLVLARAGLRSDYELAETFAALGSEVTRRDSADHDRLFAHPQQAQAPLQTISLSLQWLRAVPATATAGGGYPPTLLRRSTRIDSPSGQLTEEPLQITLGGQTAFAVLACPAGGVVGDERLCAVLLNAGALRHIGPNRMWVEAARAWAARGLATVRVDLPALGEADGDERRWVSDASLYHPSRLGQLAELLQALRDAGVGERFVLGGLCAGAYWALHEAAANPAVAAVLAINLYCFEWDPRLAAEFETLRALRSLRGSGWRRLLRRDVTESELLARARDLRLARIRQALLRPASRRQWHAVERTLDRLGDHGTELLLLFSRGEPLAGLLGHALRGVKLSERWPNVELRQLATRDHMLRALWVQREVHAILTAAVQRARERPVASRTPVL